MALDFQKIYTGLQNAPKSAPVQQTIQPKQGFFSKVGSFLGNAARVPIDAFSQAGIRTGQAAGQLARPFLSDQQNRNMDAALQKPVDVPVLGSTVQPQKDFGQGGGEQIVGQALTDASLLYGGEGIGDAIEAGTGGGVMSALGRGAIQGAKTGIIAGGLGGAGQSMSQGGSATDVLNSGIQGTIYGGIGGGVTGGVLGAGQNVWERAYGTPAGGTARVTDATPQLSQLKDQTGTITNPQGETVNRVNEGEGLTGKRTVNESKSEAANNAELENLPNYPRNGTDLQKAQAVNSGIATEAESMRGGLQAEDKATPLDAKTEKAKIEDLVKSNLPKDIQDKIGYVGKDNPLSSLGIKDVPQTDLNKALQQMQSEGNMPKTAAGRFYQQILDELKNYSGTREGKLDLRQAIDTAYEKARGKLAWGSSDQNALDEVNTSIRDSLNKDLADTTKNTDTQASLGKQSRLYRAKDVIAQRANKEAASTIGRFFQEHPLLRRLATRDFLSGAAKLTGVSAATTYVINSLRGK